MKKIFAILFAIMGFSLCSCNEPNEPQPSIPEGDYIDRAAEFEKLEGWKFRCKVYAESQTIKDEGSQEEFMKKVDKLLADASKYFQVPGINDEGGNQVHFFMTEMIEFQGDSRKYMNSADGDKDKSCDLRLIINGHPSEGDMSGGWMGSPYLNLGHDYKGLWSGYAIDALVHEFGHTRGVPDLYAAEVPAEGNPINGEAFEAVRCIMNYPYGERVWSEYAKALINASADQRICVMHYNHFPSGIKATALTADGKTATGAYMRFYPVYAYSNKVAEKPLYEGELSITGNFVFPKNPFIVPNQENPDNNITNYLVEVDHNGKRAYGWMPMYEAQLAKAQGNNNYVCTIKFTGNEVNLPKDDYKTDRMGEFEQLPGWKFRVKVYGEKQTVADYGGRIEFMKKVDKLMADASKGFQVAGLNDEGGNQIHFFMVGFEVFEGSSKSIMYKNDGKVSTEFDCRVVINAHAETGDVSGGWIGSPYLNLGHDFEGLWSGYALDALIHEFGHMRGVPDLYAAEVPANKNPINGKAYEAPTCIMNYCYGIHTWSEYAQLLINASAGQRLCVMHYNHFPKGGTQIKVVDGSGNAIEGAEIKCYPVAAYSSEVTKTARFVGTTNSEGLYKFPENPFVKAGETNLDSNNANNLIEVNYNGKTTYEWLPMFEAETAGAKGINTFVKTITIK